MKKINLLFNLVSKSIPRSPYNFLLLMYARMSNLRTVLLIVWAVFSVSLQPAQASTYLRPFAEGLLQGQVDVQYFKTEANFDSGGSNQSLLSGSSYQIIQYDIQARYNLLDSLALKLSTTIGQAESSDVIANRNNSSLSYVSGGADFLILNTDSLYSFIDVQYRHAMEAVEANTDSALNSDGVSEVHGQLFGVYDLNYFELIGSAGVNYRLDGLSTLVTYSLGAQYGFESFQLGAVAKGFASVVDDTKTNSIERDLIINRVNGGSKKFYSINPNQTVAEVFGLFDFGSAWSLKAYGGYTLIGSNTAVGFHVGGTLTFNYDGFVGSGSSGAHRVGPSDRWTPSGGSATQQRPARPPESPRKFKENTDDGVDQEIFKPVQPSQETFVKPVEEEEEMTIKQKKAVAPDHPDYKVKLIKKKQPKKKKKKPVSN